MPPRFSPATEIATAIARKQASCAAVVGLGAGIAPAAGRLPIGRVLMTAIEAMQSKDELLEGACATGG